MERSAEEGTMRISGIAFALLLAACSSTAESPPAAEVDAAAPIALPALGLNDVSVLVPIPASPAAPGALGPTDAGAKGVLLPEDVYDKVPKFGVKPAQGLDYARMRAVAIRFDGCFPGKDGCEAQIRVVMQPITDAGATLDSALHLFYRLDESELGPVVAELRRLRTLAPEVRDAPLDVHAGLAAQGLDGAYGKRLRELVLKHAGEQNLTRMTFFLRAPPRQEEWFFGGVDRAGGQTQVMNIVGVGKANQRVDRPIAAEGYTYQLTPAPKIPEDMNALLSTEAAKAATPEARAAALSALVRIENPEKYGPDALSCAGCHVATFVREATRASFGLDATKLPASDAFKSARDLTLKGEAITTPSSLRAFGYFDAKVMISNRVVNESAAVVDDLEKRFPRK